LQAPEQQLRSTLQERPESLQEVELACAVGADSAAKPMIVPRRDAITRIFFMGNLRWDWGVA
jgi:hypothetical protein